MNSLLNKNTAVGRATRTLFQGVVGWALVVLASPSTKDYLSGHAVWILPAVPVVAALVSLVQNLLDSDVPNV